MVALRAVARGMPVASAAMTQIATLTPDDPIEQAVQTLLQTSQSEFPVLDGMDKPVGLLGRADIIRALKEFGPDARVGQVMGTDLPSINRRCPLDDAVRVLQEKAAPAVVVIENDGRFAGLITTETIGELLMVRDALPKGARLGNLSRPANVQG